MKLRAGLVLLIAGVARAQTTAPLPAEYWAAAALRYAGTGSPQLLSVLRYAPSWRDPGTPGHPLNATARLKESGLSRGPATSLPEFLLLDLRLSGWRDAAPEAVRLLRAAARNLAFAVMPYQIRMAARDAGSSSVAGRPGTAIFYDDRLGARVGLREWNSASVDTRVGILAELVLISLERGFFPALRGEPTAKIVSALVTAASVPAEALLQAGLGEPNALCRGLEDRRELLKNWNEARRVRFARLPREVCRDLEQLAALEPSGRDFSTALARCRGGASALAESPDSAAELARKIIDQPEFTEDSPGALARLEQLARGIVPLTELPTTALPSEACQPDTTVLLTIRDELRADPEAPVALLDTFLVIGALLTDSTGYPPEGTAYPLVRAGLSLSALPGSFESTAALRSTDRRRMRVEMGILRQSHRRYLSLEILKE